MASPAPCRDRWAARRWFARLLARSDAPCRLSSPVVRSFPRRVPERAEALAAGEPILIAEDNPTNRVVMGKLLARLGYAGDVVVDGGEALAALGETRYGMLITDCHMLNVDGYELTRRIRQRERGEGGHIPIVALTADVLPGTAEQCRVAGMDDNLSKPVEIAALDAMLQRWLKRRTSPTWVDPAAPGGTEPAASILDISRLVETFGAVDADSIGLLHLFVETTEPLIKTVDRALTDGNVVVAREATHQIKGAANTAGAMALSAVASEVDGALKAGDLERARRTAPKLEPAFAAVSARIAELRPEQAAQA
ncbi:MAG: response regulator [Alphaproteobacteria bacterium]|nr:response regulator [Alphaproteobacteria bacterium]